MARIVRQYETLIDGDIVLAFELHCGHAIHFGTRMILLDSKRFVATVGGMAQNHRCIVTEREEQRHREELVYRNSRINPPMRFTSPWDEPPGFARRYVQAEFTVRRNPVGFDPKQLEPIKDPVFQGLSARLRESEQVKPPEPKKEPEKPKEWKKDRFELIELE